MPLRVAFFGTPTFAVPTLQRIAGSPHSLVGVVTQPDRPRGRGQQVTDSPVKARALQLGVPVFQPERLARDAFASALESIGPDIGVVAAYGKILPDWLLGAIPRGLINVHASLLPKYRGASPVHRAVLAGDRETGVTIMRVVKALDAGPMLAAARVAIGPDATTVDVETELAQRGAELLVATLDAIEGGRAVEIAQDDSQATYAPKLTKAEAPIDWTRTATAIHNQVRGLWPWPHASTYLDGVRHIIHRSRVSEGAPAGAAPGTITRASAQEGLHVACGAGTSLELLKIQLEGRRAMAARDVLAGGRIPQGARFSQP